MLKRLYLTIKTEDSILIDKAFLEFTGNDDKINSEYLLFWSSEIFLNILGIF